MSEGLRQESVLDGQKNQIASLTPREREVLVRIASGRTSREIASELSISPRTVETHRQHIVDKTGIKSVAGLTRLVVEVGLDRAD